VAHVGPWPTRADRRDAQAVAAQREAQRYAARRGVQRHAVQRRVARLAVPRSAAQPVGRKRVGRAPHGGQAPREAREPLALGARPALLLPLLPYAVARLRLSPSRQKR